MIELLLMIFGAMFVFVLIALEPPLSYYMDKWRKYWSKESFLK